MTIPFAAARAVQEFEELVHEELTEDAIGVENDRFEHEELGERPGLLGFSPAPSYASHRFNIEYLSTQEIAEQFAVSRERALIREQAEQVDLGSIGEIPFRLILEEIFRNGINTSSIIVLFYICSHVLIRGVKNALYHFFTNNLFFWALNFLVTTVCKWVNKKHGRWEKVFASVSNATTICSCSRYAAIALVVIMFCIIFYFRYDLYS